MVAFGVVDFLQVVYVTVEEGGPGTVGDGLCPFFEGPKVAGAGEFVGVAQGVHFFHHVPVSEEDGEDFGEGAEKHAAAIAAFRGGVHDFDESHFPAMQGEGAGHKALDALHIDFLHAQIFGELERVIVKNDFPFEEVVVEGADVVDNHMRQFFLHGRKVFPLPFVGAAEFGA